ncbi:M57 family metalloprotease [Marivirga harenae]|uniref:M57 family metalloprotease n=1 Tax=Marivirga harenae TaxID=2010992 RepID=UPI0026E02F37|nr:M57 family metalloprotease [Marivirga harenae]WKV11523.1 M57 family metalloprotease [Marivirga harenae]|tara:strand:- start:5509 stop:6345 length:837 start_codon:yes stop_codon:yes gene_type:complete
MLKKSKLLATALFACATLFISCQEEETLTVDELSVDPTVIQQLEDLGFNVYDQAPMIFEDGYLVEGDIYLTDKTIAEMKKPSFLPNAEQYSTDNLVCGPRTITMYAAEGGRKGYSSAMIAGLEEAINRFNAQNLTLTFQRVFNQNQADIVMTRLSKRDERRGVLGSAGFPTSSCEPFGEIKMSGVLESSYGLSTDGIATIIAHEMGHCIGFRHTDYFDRSISCGGSTANEGNGGVGANHIPGTPTGASLADASWMLSCTDGSNRPFNGDDQVALDYLY